MSESPDRLLNRCTARVTTAGGGAGTAFFVLPGKLLTCAHVVADGANLMEGPLRLCWGGHEAVAAVETLHPEPYPDAALLQVDLARFPDFAGHPCVRLGEEAQVQAPVYAFGYTGVRPDGDPVTGWIEGFGPYGGMASDQEFLKFKEGLVAPGMSGAPLLNLDTGAVCGMIRRTRDEQFPTGGIGVPAAVLLRAFEGLREAQRALHGGGPAGADAVGFNNAPELPSTYVSRHELAEARARVLAARCAPTALWGMGGVGKTVLAQALCHDEEVRARFPAGVVWITLGRQPGDLLPYLKSAGRMLGDAAGLYDGVDIARARLRERLAARAALLVLDDVWSPVDAAPFVPPPGPSRLVLTTRDAGVAAALEAERLPVGVLPPGQAVELLRGWARRGDPDLETLARRLGALPLALRIAGTRLREGLSAREYMVQFDRVSRMKQGYRAREPHDNLQVCFDVSVALLGEERPLYLALGVFPDDREVPQAAVARLWRTLRPDLSAHDCGELLQEMARLGLLEFGIQRALTMHDLLHEYCREQAGGDLKVFRDALLRGYNPDTAPWSSLPDDGYLHANLAWHLEDTGRAGELRALLREELDRRNGWYVARAQAGDTAGFLSDVTRAWLAAEGEDRAAAAGEGFLPMLGQEARYALMHSSVRSLSADFPTGILRALVRTGVWTLPRALLHVHQFPDAVLRVDSFLSLAEPAAGEPAREVLLKAAALMPEVPEGPPAIDRWRILLGSMTEKGFAAEALRLLRGVDSLHRQALVAEHLAEHFADPVLARGLYEIQQSYVDPADRDQPYWRLHILRELVRSAPELRAQAADDLLALLRSQRFYHAGGDAWVTLIEHLPNDRASALLDQALEGIAGMPESAPPVDLPARLAARLPAAVDRILATVFAKTPFPDDRSEFVAAVWPWVTPDQRERVLDQLLDHTRAFPFEDHAPAAFARAACLAPDRAPALWDEAFAAVTGVWEHYRLLFVRAFASSVPEDGLGALAEVAAGIGDASEQVKAFEALLAARPCAPVFERVLAVLPGLDSESSRGRLAAALAHAAHLANDPGGFQAALATIDALKEVDQRTEATAAVLPLLSSEARGDAFDRVFVAVTPPSNWLEAAALHQLARRAEGVEQEAVLAFCLSTADLELRTALLQDLAPTLPRELLRQVEASAGRLGDAAAVHHASTAFRELPDLLPDGPWHEPSPERELSSPFLRRLLYEIGRRGGDRSLRTANVRAMTQMLLRVGDREEAVSAVVTLRADLREHPLAAAVEEVAVHLAPVELDDLVDRIRGEISNPVYQLKSVHRVLRLLPEKRRAELVDEILDELERYDYAEKAECLGLLAPHLEGVRREAAIREAVERFFAHPLWGGADTWIALAPLLTHEQLRRAHQMAIDLRIEYDDSSKAEMLLALGPFRPEALADGFNQAVHADKHHRAELLARHAPRLRGGARDTALRDGAAAARSLREENLCVRSLVLVAVESDPPFRAELLETAVDTALADDHDGERATLLAALVPQLLLLPHSERGRIAMGALHRASGRNRPGALVDLQALRFLLAAVGGSAAMRDTAEAIDDVARWWP